MDTLNRTRSLPPPNDLGGDDTFLSAQDSDTEDDCPPSPIFRSRPASTDSSMSFYHRQERLRQARQLREAYHSLSKHASYSLDPDFPFASKLNHHAYAFSLPTHFSSSPPGYYDTLPRRMSTNSTTPSTASASTVSLSATTLSSSPSSITSRTSDTDTTSTAVPVHHVSVIDSLSGDQKLSPSPSAVSEAIPIPLSAHASTLPRHFNALPEPPRPLKSVSWSEALTVWDYDDYMSRLEAIRATASEDDEAGEGDIEDVAEDGSEIATVAAAAKPKAGSKPASSKRRRSFGGWSKIRGLFQGGRSDTDFGPGAFREQAQC
ncbi:hypothetical protein HK097_007730 [Rhizophlyctis rosea]|uniref:Uncharacterized protein n=1 Tax=Rhizophlyctis rosea TaxID=64517 RepID=A0AAD5X516_9FUNG|nr:hypothetical protein HK097_007730 [Rhizophlyctis rosea]